MVLLTTKRICALALLSTLSSAQYAIESLSFGHSGSISQNGQSIPGWQLSGEGHTPQILSDRVILTPPMPGSARGALWSDAGITQQHWTVDFLFRASGQERGTGNLQLWFAKDGRSTIGTNSVYTVHAFEGMVLTVDQYGGGGGMLRGFLNDGTTDFKNHHSVDSLAFGHCNFPYRNLGRSSNIRVTNDASTFRVLIDDRECFSTNQLSLPTGYHFGITAATADNPDSFEVNRFLVRTLSDEPFRSQNRPPPPASNNAPPAGHHLPNAPEMLADADASSIRRQEEQFADLHNRLQGMSHQLANVFSEFERLSSSISNIHNDLVGRIPKSSDEGISSLSRRLETIERSVERIQRDVEGRDYGQHFSNLQSAVEGVRGGLAEGLPDRLGQIVTGSAPRMGMFIFVIVAVQIMMFGAYLVYKKRRDSAPKKYL